LLLKLFRHGNIDKSPLKTQLIISG